MLSSSSPPLPDPVRGFPHPPLKIIPYLTNERIFCRLGPPPVYRGDAVCGRTVPAEIGRLRRAVYRERVFA